MALTIKYGTDIADKDNKRGKLKFEDMGEIATKMSNTFSEVLEKYDWIKLNTENVDITSRFYSAFADMVNTAKYVKDEMRNIVIRNKTNGQMSHVINIKGKCPQEFYLDRELLRKIIDVSMQDFCYFEIYKGGKQLITYDYFDSEITEDSKVILTFSKIFPE